MNKFQYACLLSLSIILLIEVYLHADLELFCTYVSIANDCLTDPENYRITAFIIISGFTSWPFLVGIYVTRDKQKNPKVLHDG